MTIALWARWDALNSWSRLCEFADGEYDDNIHIGNCETQANLFWYLYEDSSGSGIVYEGTIVLGAWTHVVGTVQDTTTVLYQDGAVVSTNTAAFEVSSMTRANHWLGRSSWASHGYFHGAIKSMQIWSRALDASEVASLYA